MPAISPTVLKSSRNNLSFEVQLLTKSVDSGMVMTVQSGEAVDMTEFSDKIQRPMMEMRAGSNVWYQAHIQDSNRKKLLVLFPGNPFGPEPAAKLDRRSL